LARGGVVFRARNLQVPLTWPSHAAILTGLYPFQNGVQDFTGQPSTPACDRQRKHSSSTDMLRERL